MNSRSTCAGYPPVAGIVAGAVAGAICTASTLGAGVVGCAIIAGAIGGAVEGAVTHGLDVAAGRADGGWKGWAGAVLGGAALGAAIGGVAAVVGAAALGGAIALGARTGAKAAATGAKAAKAGATGGRGSKAAAQAGRRNPGCHSFDPDTPVLMANGTTKPIKDVKVGDTVRATDPATKVTAPKQIKALHNNLDVYMAEVTVLGSAGSHTIQTTQNHSFWSASRNEWVDAGQLQPGEHLHTDDGQPVTVLAVRNHVNPHVMRDLTVDSTHTYYVFAGTTAVLVHNCGPDDLVDVYRTPQRGNGADELANGLDPVRHTEGNMVAYVGTEDVAQKFADPRIGTHENWYIKFTLKRSDLDRIAKSWKYEGGPGREWEIPHDKIDLFNRLTIHRGRG